MNYIAELKAFYDRLELNPLPSPAIALWHALMSIANKTGWQQEFTVAVSILMLKSGLNAQAIKRARNRLGQDGYLTWYSRAGSQSAVYCMKSLVVQKNIKNVPQNELQSDPQSKPQSELHSEPINKHKQNKIITPITPLEQFEYFWDYYPLDKNKAAVEMAYSSVIADGIYTEVDLVDAAKNYAEYCCITKKEERFIKHANNWLYETVFVDYLPGKYRKPQVKSKNSFWQIEQHEYDFDTLEKELTKN